MLTERLRERLKSIVSNAEQLPPAAQEKLAEEISCALVNALWDAGRHDPKERQIRSDRSSAARDEDLADGDDITILLEGE
jgi:hypothetical protein